MKLCNFCLRNKTHSTGTLFLNFEYKFFESVLLNSVFFSSEFRDVFDSLLEYSHSLLPVVCVVLHFLPVLPICFVEFGSFQKKFFLQTLFYLYFTFLKTTSLNEGGECRVNKSCKSVKRTDRKNARNFFRQTVYR